MSDNEFKMTRTFDASIDRVWEAWTQPEHAKQWFGPDGFTTPVYEADLRPGGRMYYEMEAPDGTRFPNDGTIVEIAPPNAIVVDGEVRIAGQKAFDVRTDVRFTQEGERTRMDVRQTFSNVSELGRQAIEGGPTGWAQMLDKFDAYLHAQAAAR